MGIGVVLLPQGGCASKVGGLTDAVLVAGMLQLPHMHMDIGHLSFGICTLQMGLAVICGDVQKTGRGRQALTCRICKSGRLSLVAHLEVIERLRLTSSALR